jgi:hypothetical protein
MILKKKQPRFRTSKQQIRRCNQKFWIFAVLAFLANTGALACLVVGSLTLFSPTDDKSKFWFMWFASLGFIGMSFTFTKEGHDWLETGKEIKDRYNGS